ncbi:MAG: DUF255 domain-containing protein, partial [Rubripirellula sp.]
MKFPTPASLPMINPPDLRSCHLCICISLAVFHTTFAQSPDTKPASTQHTNQLAKESSPYLLQHAHNPVDWYPWGEEAFAKAKREGKMVFLSVGYAACHWCHVME